MHRLEQVFLVGFSQHLFSMDESLLAFFADHKRIFLTFHLIGVAVGMGGATITDILFFNFLRDFEVSKKEAEVMHILSNVIMVALGILFVSGMALYFSDPSTFNTSPAFLSKATIVVILIINGVLMHKFVAPHMVHFSFLHPIHEHKTMHKLRSVAFAMGAVSFTSWYSVFLIAMLKSYIPETAGVFHILGGYLIVLLSAITVSQIVHHLLHKKSLLQFFD